MAAVTVDRARPCAPVGYEVNDKCVLADDVEAGQLLTYTGNMSNGLPEMGLAPTDTVNAHAIALMDGYDGERGFSVGIQGEMDGFEDLTPGDPLYPSGSTAGGIDTTAPEFYGAETTPAVAVPAAANIRAVTDTRIRYNFT